MTVIRNIREEDMANIARIERESFSDAWSEKSLLETFAQSHVMMHGAWEEEALAGYAIVYTVWDEGEIARIAVGGQYRRRGVASALLAALEKACAARGIGRLLLDVRESNTAAAAFYRKHGFSVDGIRKSFYEHPREDALLMSRILGNELAAFTAVSTGLPVFEKI